MKVGVELGPSEESSGLCLPPIIAVGLEKFVLEEKLDTQRRRGRVTMVRDGV